MRRARHNLRAIRIPSPPASLAEPATGQYFAAGEDIYGPFEAGFSSRQDFVLSALGCATGKGYVDGGIDTMTAEALIAERMQSLAEAEVLD